MTHIPAWMESDLLITYCLNIGIKNICQGTSLVAQWLRIRLPTQGTRVRALVREDQATKPVCHNY